MIQYVYRITPVPLICAQKRSLYLFVFSFWVGQVTLTKQIFLALQDLQSTETVRRQIVIPASPSSRHCSSRAITQQHLQESLLLHNALLTEPRAGSTELESTDLGNLDFGTTTSTAMNSPLTDLNIQPHPPLVRAPPGQVNRHPPLQRLFPQPTNAVATTASRLAVSGIQCQGNASNHPNFDQLMSYNSIHFQNDSPRSDVEEDSSQTDVSDEENWSFNSIWNLQATFVILYIDPMMHEAMLISILIKKNAFKCFWNICGCYR